MRKPALAILAVAVLVGLTGTSAAQPGAGPAAPPAPEETAAEAPAAAAAPAAAPAAPAAVTASLPAAVPAAPAAAPSTFGPPSQPEQPAGSPIGGRRLSERTALALSLGITLASWTAIFVDARDPGPGGTLAKLGAIGALAGPSVGHWYRGAILTRGMFPRVLSTVGMFAAIVTMGECEGECKALDRILMGGLALFLIGTVDDIITAPLRVRAHNRSLEGVSLAPMVTAHGAGIALGGRF